MSEVVNGQTYVYSSAGMFEFRAFQQNQELLPNPDNPITINYASSFDGDNYRTYYLNPESNNWDDLGKDSIISTYSDTNNLKEEDLPTIERPIRPELPMKPFKKDYINVQFVYNKKTKEYRVRFCANNRKWGRRDTSNKVFSELKHLNRSKWKLDYDKSIKKDKKELIAFSSELDWYNEYDRLIKRRLGSRNRWGSMNLVDDVWIEPNAEGDNFNLVISKSGALKKIEVIPSKIPRRVETAQRKTRLYYSRYKKDLDKRRSDWAKVDKNFYGAEEAYLIAMENYEKDIKEYRSAMETYRMQRSQRASVFRMGNRNISLRASNILSFGLINYDIYQPIRNTKPLLANLVDEEGQTLKYKRLYILDFEINGLLEYRKNQRKVFDPEHANSIIAILAGDKVAVLNSTNFNSKEMKKRNTTVALKEYDLNGRSISELRKDNVLF